MKFVQSRNKEIKQQRNEIFDFKNQPVSHQEIQWNILTKNDIGNKGNNIHFEDLGIVSYYAITENRWLIQK